VWCAVCWLRDDVCGVRCVWCGVWGFGCGLQVNVSGSVVGGGGGFVGWGGVLCDVWCRVTLTFHELFAGKRVLTPVAWYIDLGLDNVIKNFFFNDPDWLEMWHRRPLPPSPSMLDTAFQVRTPWINTATDTRRDSTVGHFWSSPEADRLRRELPVVRQNGMSILDHESTSTWELLIDWAQPFQGTTYSTGVLAVRCSSLQEMDRNKRANCKVLVVIPGPAEPESLDVHFQLTSTIFQKFGPLYADVRPASSNAPSDPRAELKPGLQVAIPQLGTSQRVTTHLWLYLTGILADTVARCKMSKENAVSAYAFCGACTFMGTMYEGEKKSSIYYKGYSAPAKQYRYFLDAPTFPGMWYAGCGVRFYVLFAVCVLWVSGCWLQVAVCWLWGSWCGVLGAGCRVWGALCVVRGAGCGGRGAGCRVRGAVCGVRCAVCGVHGAGCGVYCLWCGVWCAGCVEQGSGCGLLCAG
jgi:hypothetical protein